MRKKSLESFLVICPKQSEKAYRPKTLQLLSLKGREPRHKLEAQGKLR